MMPVETLCADKIKGKNTIVEMSTFPTSYVTHNVQRQESQWGQQENISSDAGSAGENIERGEK